MTQQQKTNSSNSINNSNFKSEDQLDNLTVRPSQPSYVTPPPTTTTPCFPVFQTKSTLPAFLNKLYGMVNSPDTDPWVHWNESGDSFIIPNSQAMAEQVLGRHFKHNNFASFVRQLNMYGFHKVPHLNHGVLHNDGLPEVWEFNNVNFHRDQPGRMRFIVRKKGEAEKARTAAKQQSTSPSLTNHQPNLSDPADIAIARAEIQQLANRQNIIRGEVMRLAGSTESLWKYALETRHHYQEQQVKLDKLIKFLSEAFRQRLSNTELHKVRGLLEGPSAFEELSEDAASVHTPSEQGQLDVMKMIANGKIPVGLQEAIQHYLQTVSQGNVLPQTPVSPTPFESSDALMTYQINNNAQHLAQIQDWVNHMDQGLNGVGIDSNNNSNGNYAEYLNDPNFNFDSFVPVPNPDPSMDMFAATDTSFDPSLQPWMSQYLNSEQGQQDTSIAGLKREFGDEEDEASSVKRAKIQKFC